MKNAILIGNGPFAIIGAKMMSKLNIDISLVLADHKDTGQDSWQASFVKHLLNNQPEWKSRLIQPKSPNDDSVLEKIRAISPNFIFVFQGRSILKTPLISLARDGVVNFHNAPLPLLRGCDPFAWAIHDGLREMGVTLHKISDGGIDTGEIFGQLRWEIGPADTCWSLYQTALRKAEILFNDCIPCIIDGRNTGVPQDNRYATYHPMGQFNFRELEIDWHLPGMALSAWIRSRYFPPRQRPFFLYNGQEVAIESCEYSQGRGTPGEVVCCNPLIIAAKTGGIHLREVQMAGSIVSGTLFAKQANLANGQVI